EDGMAESVRGGGLVWLPPSSRSGRHSSTLRRSAVQIQKVAERTVVSQPASLFMATVANPGHYAPGVRMAKRPQKRQDEIVGRFAARLREVRLARGMTQAELAAVAKVTETYITRLEAGRAAPGIDLVNRLAKGLSTTVADLLPQDDP